MSPHSSYMILQTLTFTAKLLQQSLFFSNSSNLFSLQTLAWACVLQFHLSIISHTSTMPLYISTKLLLLFILCILYTLKNSQAKTGT